ncbi:ATP-binding cassette domain-containing protein [Corynebacterium variabile]|uniref:ATP-binding cassette domain-containing protein n=1 Tax=Corynebacterium variabile TaxID=1727 RepID=UPI00289C5CD6|nr:ATP-binding cassette domain-containing protein [Corynebacterium variabile]
MVSADTAVHRRILDTVAGEAGTLLLDGVDARSLDPRVLPGVLRISPHTPHLFAGTVVGNITGPEGGPLPEALLRASGVDELVDLFADGAGHPVDGAGANLSGGQQQRIVLARALAGTPRTRVLVDPTTAVDSVTEARIAEGLRELRAGERQGTLVVVTTSPTLLAVADGVVLVGDGALRRATHAELLADDSYRAVVSR